jgi:hypothetical protein
MARTNSFSLTVDAKGAMPSLADKLGRISGSVIGLGARDAVNEVMLRFERDALGGMTGDIGLQPAYVRSKTDVRLATAALNPRAEMVTRGDLTILGRFPLRQLIQPASRRAKGDPSRGIPAGTKQAGVQATIRRSAPVARDKWFTMRLRAGREPGENIGVFVRATGRDKPKQIYGPAPYSLFRFQVEKRIGDVEADLGTTTLRAIADRVEKALA